MASNNTVTRKSFLRKSVEVCLVALLLLVSPAPALALSLTVEEDNSSSPAVANSVRGEFIETTLPDYQSFVTMVQNGEQGVLRGVYVPGVLALPVVQQPLGNPGFVSQRNNELTQFSMATEVGNVGLLAHNFLSGATFTSLSIGQEVRLIYGDGTVEYFEIDQILRYQALQPFSPTSQFRDLETDLTITAEQVFGKVYRGERHVTLQTCIDANGNSSWGRLFVIAHPKLFPQVEQQYIRDDLLPVLY